MTFITLLLITCTILRAFLFNQRGEKPWKSLIPLYNKYVLGQLSDSKKLGIITVIFCALTYISALFSYYVELMMLSLIPSGTDFSTAKIKDYIPDDLVAINDASKIIMLIFAIIFIMSWSLMMRQFSEKNNANTWWILGWAICPIICYIYFIFINNYYYTTEKELVKYEVKTVSEKEKRTIKKDKKDNQNKKDNPDKKDNKIKDKTKKLRKRKESKDE